MHHLILDAPDDVLVPTSRCTFVPSRALKGGSMTNQEEGASEREGEHTDAGHDSHADANANANADANANAPDVQPPNFPMAMIGGAGEGAGGLARWDYVLTNSAGTAIREARGRPRTYKSTKPCYAAAKAFYAWLRANGASWKRDRAMHTPVDIPAALDAHLTSLLRRGRINAEDRNKFLARLREVDAVEVTTAVEIFIVRSDKRTPRRYVCHQQVNVKPNEHQVKARIVIETRAAPMAAGKPDGIVKLLRPFE